MKNWLPLIGLMGLVGCCAKPQTVYVASPPPKLQVSSELLSPPESPPERQKLLKILNDSGTPTIAPASVTP